jgi:hypothetical protein
MRWGGREAGEDLKAAERVLQLTVRQMKGLSRRVTHLIYRCKDYCCREHGLRDSG